MNDDTPWTIETDHWCDHAGCTDAHHETLRILDDLGLDVAHYDSPYDAVRDQYRRIVASVNVCRGISLDVLEAQSVTIASPGVIPELREERDKLLAFKAWVHAYLDAHGCPAEFPDGPHTREGCRIGDRMDWLVAERDAALAMLRRLADVGTDAIFSHANIASWGEAVKDAHDLLARTGGKDHA